MNLVCNLYVDGAFEGVINSQNEVYIGKNGHVNGDIIAEKLIIQGFVDGTVNTRRVEIKEGGRVKGTIESSELIIEAKGLFEGNSIVKNSASSNAKETLKIAKH